MQWCHIYISASGFDDYASARHLTLHYRKRWRPLDFNARVIFRRPHIAAGADIRFYTLSAIELAPMGTLMIFERISRASGQQVGSAPRLIYSSRP